MRTIFRFGQTTHLDDKFSLSLSLSLSLSRSANLQNNPLWSSRLLAYDKILINLYLTKPISERISRDQTLLFYL